MTLRIGSLPTDLLCTVLPLLWFLLAFFAFLLWFLSTFFTFLPNATFLS